jgi:hypothetical protein
MIQGKMISDPPFSDCHLAMETDQDSICVIASKDALKLDGDRFSDVMDRFSRAMNFCCQIDFTRAGS